MCLARLLIRLSSQGVRVPGFNDEGGLMKKIILALALLAPLLGTAEERVLIGSDGAVRGRATRLAQDLGQRLGKLALLADEVADGAASNGNGVRARRFRAVSVEAQCLALEVRQTVIRPLRSGVRLPEVGRAVDRLMGQFGQLGQSVQVIVALPLEIQITVGQLVRDLRTLRSIL